MFNLIKNFQRGPSAVDFEHSNIGVRVLSVSKLLREIF